MLNRTTLARPYARAAYLVASEQSGVARWTGNLGLAAQVALTEPMPELLHDPRLMRDQLLEVFMDVGGAAFDASFVNFLKTLSAYRRLALLPDIHVQFEALRRAAEARIQVEVTSAYPMNDEETAHLTERLRARYGREIDLDLVVDSALIGGAIIRAQDQVIDGSVRGQLERLARQVAA